MMVEVFNSCLVMNIDIHSSIRRELNGEDYFRLGIIPRSVITYDVPKNAY
jgi:hypothetical protein